MTSFYCFSYLLEVVVSCGVVVSDIVVVGLVPGFVVASVVNGSVDPETFLINIINREYVVGVVCIVGVQSKLTILTPVSQIVVILSMAVKSFVVEKSVRLCFRLSTAGNVSSRRICQGLLYIRRALSLIRCFSDDHERQRKVESEKD